MSDPISLSNILTEEFLHDVASFEGFYSRPYRCPSGVLTIGYGHTRDVKKIGRLTSSQAFDLLYKDLTSCYYDLKKFYDISVWPVGMVQCYVDFIFNCGVGTLRRSSMHNILKSFSSLNEDDKPSYVLHLTCCLREYCYSRGRKLKGLDNRRAYEQSLFLNSFGITLS